MNQYVAGAVIKELRKKKLINFDNIGESNDRV